MTNNIVFLFLCLYIAASLVESFPSQPRQSPGALSSSKVGNNIILYDGVCKFCNKWVDLLLRIDSKKSIRFAALQSSYGKQALTALGKETDDISTVIYIRSASHFYVKSNAILEVMKETNPSLYALAMLLTIVPLPVRDSFYDLVAKNRYNFLGKRNTCRCGDDDYADRFLS